VRRAGGHTTRGMDASGWGLARAALGKLVQWCEVWRGREYGCLWGCQGSGDGRTCAGACMGRVEVWSPCNPPAAQGEAWLVHVSVGRGTRVHGWQTCSGLGGPSWQQVLVIRLNLTIRKEIECKCTNLLGAQRPCGRRRLRRRGAGRRRCVRAGRPGACGDGLLQQPVQARHQARGGQDAAQAVERQRGVVLEDLLAHHTRVIARPHMPLTFDLSQSGPPSLCTRERGCGRARLYVVILERLCYMQINQHARTRTLARHT
jgi:hypothetical protein